MLGTVTAVICAPKIVLAQQLIQAAANLVLVEQIQMVKLDLLHVVSDLGIDLWNWNTTNNK